MTEKKIIFMSSDSRDKWALFFVSFVASGNCRNKDECATAADDALREYRKRHGEDTPDKVGACGDVKTSQDTKPEESN